MLLDRFEILIGEGLSGAMPPVGAEVIGGRLYRHVGFDQHCFQSFETFSDDFWADPVTRNNGKIDVACHANIVGPCSRSGTLVSRCGSSCLRYTSLMNGAVLARIEGRVQGVGFRFWTQTEATRLGLTGWVRNEDDGTVVAHFEGSIDVIGQMVRLLWQGPKWSQVTNVTLEDDLEQGFTRFATRY